MHEERKLIAQGYPLEDAITLCNSMRRTGELSDFMGQNHERTQKNHVCTCGGKCGCKECPNKNR